MKITLIETLINVIYSILILFLKSFACWVIYPFLQAAFPQLPIINLYHWFLITFLAFVLIRPENTEFEFMEIYDDEE